QAAGHEVVIISASEKTLVRLIAEELGVEHVVATELETVDGRFTGGIVHYLKGHAKADAVAKIGASENIDLSQSFAYSDSATDIPMLELVGNPVVEYRLEPKLCILRFGHGYSNAGISR